MICWLFRTSAVSRDVLSHPNEAALVVSPGGQHCANLCPGQIIGIHFHYRVHIMGSALFLFLVPS